MELEQVYAPTLNAFGRVMITTGLVLHVFSLCHYIIKNQNGGDVSEHEEITITVGEEDKGGK